jgi:hypothetical protein
MTRIAIDHIALRVHGVSVETARAAIAGLDAELLRRMNVRDLDHLGTHGLSPTIRLPAIEAGSALDAESLRAHIAQGLAAFLNDSAFDETASTQAQTEEP